MPRDKKAPKEIQLRVPIPNPNIDNWIVLGLDPSVSRIGYALLSMFPDPNGGEIDPKWLQVGSAKPDKIEDDRHFRTTLWIRSKAIALFIRDFLRVVPPERSTKSEFHVCATENCCKSRTGLIISMEYPTPMNDFLVALNRIIHVVLFDAGCSGGISLADRFGEIRILTTNASTLRSLMGLKQRGAKNKKENIEKAYAYVDQSAYPELDSDACDAVLMAMMGRYAAWIMLGEPDKVPNSFLTSLCNAAVEVKGKGRNAHTVTKGILHRSEYWYTYERQSYGIGVKDASNPKKTLTRKYFLI